MHLARINVYRMTVTSVLQVAELIILNHMYQPNTILVTTQYNDIQIAIAP